MLMQVKKKVNILRMLCRYNDGFCFVNFICGLSQCQRLWSFFSTVVSIVSRSNIQKLILLLLIVFSGLFNKQITIFVCTV